jgi:CheY-like chemotaxis protein
LMTYERILLIEDDDDDRSFFLEAVRQINPALNVSSLSAADEALEKLVSGEIKVDIIFLDLNLPRMKGAEFLEKIKLAGDLKKIPVIVLTTASDPDTMEIIKKFGAKAFITKPGSLDELQRTLGAILRPVMYL